MTDKNAKLITCYPGSNRMGFNFNPPAGPFKYVESPAAKAFAAFAIGLIQSNCEDQELIIGAQNLAARLELRAISLENAVTELTQFLGVKEMDGNGQEVVPDRA